MAKRLLQRIVLPVGIAIVVVLALAAAFTLPWDEVNLFGEPNAPDGPSESQQFFVTVGALVGLVGIPTAVAGLFFVYQQQVAAADDRRREHSPLVRLDLVPSDAEQLHDMSPIRPYFESDANSIVFNDYAEVGAYSISALLRNLQTHPLGIAYNVEASFFVVARSPDGAVQLRTTRVEVPYLSSERPVRLGVVEFPRTWWVAVRLSNLAYSDLYLTDRALPAEHEGVHGRLLCQYDGSAFRADPEFVPDPDTMRAAAVAFARRV